MILTSGPQFKNVDKILVSNQMKEALQELKVKADIILVDSPPVLVAADAAILSTHVDGVLLVVDAGQTRYNDAKRAMSDIRPVHGNLMGVILNRYASRQNSYYYYYSYYHSNGKEKKKKHKPTTSEENHFSGITGQESPYPVDEELASDEIFSIYKQPIVNPKAHKENDCGVAEDRTARAAL